MAVFFCLYSKNVAVGISCSGHSWMGRMFLLTLYVILSQKQVLSTRAGFKNWRHNIDQKIIQVLLTGYKLGFSVQIF